MTRLALALSIVPLLATAASALADAVRFESPPVHPLELSADGNTLFAVHTADHRLVVFDLAGAQPAVVDEIPVGLEPVSVRARTHGEVWVVNHLSDSISIVDVTTGHVTATLLVGDEPTDVVFAGSPPRAFVVVSQEDKVEVYDPANLAAPPVDIPLQTSDPRSAAVSNDGNTVYVTALEGGNQTTIVPVGVVDANGGPPPPDPPLKAGLPAPPSTGLVVRWDGASWRDETGGDWSFTVGFTMPDQDVVVIDANARAVTGSHSSVGTTMFNVAVNPVTDELYVSNQEAFNEIRFEPNLQGRFAQNRVTHISAGGVVTPRHLNDHIDYANPAGSDAERALSLAIPLDLAVSSDGQDVYVAAFGSDKVGVLDSAGNVVRRLDVGEGPAGLALDEPRNRLYVLHRFTSSLGVVNPTTGTFTELPLGFDPTPVNVREGRRFLYDAKLSSAHGDLACATCHVFSGLDNMGWDLGDPQGDLIAVPPSPVPLPDFHPMKGVMTTQALKGLFSTEPLHWRGDRDDFQAFNGAFVALMGRGSELPAGDMQQFEDFIFSVAYPPNPYRNLDGSLPTSLDGANPQNGEALFLTGNLVGGVECVSCHTLPTGENGTIIPGPLLLEDEAKVVPQLRNMYEKTRFTPDQLLSVRGFGFTHDGGIENLFEFLEFPAFTFASDADQRDVEAFLHAFDTGTHAATGAQWTMDGSNETAGLGRVQTLQSVADGNAVGLIAKGRLAGQPRGWVYLGAGVWRPDKEADADTDLTGLLALAGSGTEITFTAVVEGCETRLGIDRDEDGFRDGDERDAGSDPGDPSSTPGATAVDDAWEVGSARLWLASANPTGGRTRLHFEASTAGEVSIEVFDVRGRRVRQLWQGQGGLAKWPQEVVWNLRDQSGRRVPSGVYFVRLATPEATQTRSVTVLQ